MSRRTGCDSARRAGCRMDGGGAVVCDLGAHRDAAAAGVGRSPKCPGGAAPLGVVAPAALCGPCRRSSAVPRTAFPVHVATGAPAARPNSFHPLLTDNRARFSPLDRLGGPVSRLAVTVVSVSRYSLAGDVSWDRSRPPTPPTPTRPRSAPTRSAPTRPDPVIIRSCLGSQSASRPSRALLMNLQLAGVSACARSRRRPSGDRSHRAAAGTIGGRIGQRLFGVPRARCRT